MTGAAAPRVLGVRTVGIGVSDQARALEFYSAVLGLEKTLDVSTPGGARWIEVSPALGGTTVALVAAGPD